MSILLCLSLFGKDITLNGYILSTHDEAGGGYGIETQKGVYGLCYYWDNDQIVNQLEKIEQSGQSIQLSGKQTGKWEIDCASINFINKGTSKKEDNKVSSPPIQVKITSEYNESWKYYYPRVWIISLSDDITIKDVLVNKGNCKYKNQDVVFRNGKMKVIDKLPKHLIYGKNVSINLGSNCNVLKIDIFTDVGDFTYNLN